jgi:prephenate dehydrogenase
MFLEGKTVAIVGGYGKMGTCLAKLLKQGGVNVIICGRRANVAEEVAGRIGVDFAPMDEAVSEADVCILSVPIDKTYEVGMRVARSMKKNSLLIDITSVKSGVADRLERDLPRSIKYVSIHPLFGPSVRSLRNRNVIMIKGRDFRVASKLASFLERRGANTLFLTVKEHDRLMASVQALHHFVLTSFFNTLKERVGDLRRLRKAMPESFKITLRSIGRIMRNMGAVREIRKFNPYAEEAIAEYVALLNRSTKR